ncbi:MULTISPECIES: GNAT family N-acetyltransferase [unclassified Mesorhizobium]|uniref:GNAT family N-acetyltransferase n=1 Tax=unclassified Mesorhizobium TaxID=325217 RepID=UPI000FD61672|nr:MULTISPECIES: GNAT family N-acetyltransferase [unclassified Mesorhizobium]RUX09696.1 GNAT family N-acetyltransferase [Mesorhizobium sp. M8A.F.Ca.ET.059.01.1.1]RVD62106.1 GNAT family N-acetyltransferase [Mesorhizobium sp. M8A.F.Ca.ET.023.02.2.1]RWC80567.1 MAG: GNAT family N-acetyltransferase [Mesorhizobium sp.]TGT90770.1 GNAT family N-acetyltransferase [Mesorhizobium sp. M8A.F.Ca.ET.161.01.1.1]TGV43950.1 GNAT family N-acetyltransferase [Mesorhizobium sp. M8A.F.Ca.ET.142.01.1.1]
MAGSPEVSPEIGPELGPGVGYALKRLRPTVAAFDALKDESRLEGYWMLVRLGDGWASGRNKFLKRGEGLFGIWHGRELAGVCGLNIDPYFEGRDQGRVRHLFVSARHRRNGLGRMLVETVIDRAGQYFSVLNTRAPPEAFGFYERLGFQRVEGEEFVTHRIVFGKGN